METPEKLEGREKTDAEMFAEIDQLRAEGWTMSAINEFGADQQYHSLLAKEGEEPRPFRTATAYPKALIPKSAAEQR